MTRQPTAKARGRAVSDRSLNRAIAALALLLAVGLPAIALVYYLDRHVDGGPSLVERAILAGEEAVRAEPNRLSARIALATAYAAAGRQADAADQYSQVLAVDSDNSGALLGRADALRALGQLDAAAADYQALIDGVAATEMAPIDAQLQTAYYNLGVIALEQQRPRDAASHFADALLIDRTDADALNQLGRALIAIGDYTNAAAALRDASALVPTGWCDPYAHLGEAYTGLADSAGAAYAAGMVALCEDRLGDAEQALAPLTAGPYARDALIGLAFVAETRGDVDAAITYYGRVYAIDPGDFAAVTGLNRLGGADVIQAASPTVGPSATPDDGED